MGGSLIYLSGLLLALVFAWLIIEGIRYFQVRRLLRGGQYRNLAECKRAIEHFSQRLKRDPRDWEAYKRRGEAFVSLKDHQRATHDFTSALALHPDDEHILLQRASSYCKLRQYEEAIWDCTRALDLTPDYIPAYSVRGLAYFASNEYDLATRDYSRAIALHPDDARGYVNRGYYYLRRMELDLARADLQRSWDLRPNLFAGLMLNWLKLGQDKGQEDAEIADELERVATLDPKHPKAYLCQAIALYLRGAYSQALAKLAQAEFLLSEHEFVYFWRGMVLASAKRKMKADQAFSRTSDLGLPRALWQPLKRLNEQTEVSYHMYGQGLIE